MSQIATTLLLCLLPERQPADHERQLAPNPPVGAFSIGAATSGGAIADPFIG